MTDKYLKDIPPDLPKVSEVNPKGMNKKTLMAEVGELRTSMKISGGYYSNKIRDLEKTIKGNDAHNSNLNDSYNVKLEELRVTHLARIESDGKTYTHNHNLQKRRIVVLDELNQKLTKEKGILEYSNALMQQNHLNNIARVTTKLFARFTAFMILAGSAISLAVTFLNPVL